jgi:hypothetical protein
VTTIEAQPAAGNPGASAEHTTMLAGPPMRPNGIVGRLPAPAAHVTSFVRRASSQLVPYITHQVHYVGRAGIVGITLIVFSAVCFVSANAPMREQLTDLQSEYSSAQQLHAKTGDERSAPSPKERRAALEGKLQPRAELPAVTETIVAQAAKAGLALERGSYTVDVVRSAQLVRARLTFPVHGSYPKVREFIDGTLAAVAGATVDGLRLERKEIGAPEIDADIRFVVYLKNTP